MSSGTCTIHSWNDGADDDEAEPRMGKRVDEKLRLEMRFYNKSPKNTRTGLGRREGLRSQRVPATNNDDDRDERW